MSKSKYTDPKKGLMLSKTDHQILIQSLENTLKLAVKLQKGGFIINDTQLRSGLFDALWELAHAVWTTYTDIYGRAIQLTPQQFDAQIERIKVALAGHASDTSIGTVALRQLRKDLLARRKKPKTRT